MSRFRMPWVASLLLLSLAACPIWAGGRELKTVELADAVVHQFAAIPLHAIPAELLQNAAGVAILPHVVKAGLVLDGRFGRGVALVRMPDGAWSNPVFITLEGIGIGGQAGVESTDLILIFKTKHSLDRVLHGKGKLTLGGDITVATGPVGRDAEVATDARLRAEILSYSRSKGLFAGVSVEGGALRVDHDANESFYNLRGGKPADVLAHRGMAAVEGLRGELRRLSTPPMVVPPVVIAPPPPPVIVVPPRR